ncbi:DUF6454 family protein [Nocardioides korecus]
MTRPRLRTTAALAALALLMGGAATAAADTARAHRHDGALARDVAALDRTTAWTQVDKIKLDFPTYHTEGLAITPDHLFLSAVQIIEPTQKYPSPVGGYDRTPGKGIGHLFVMDRAGHLQRDITLGSGDVYHPGGISYDGHDVWVPVAQYRPDSSAIVYRVDARSLAVHRQFGVEDHVGGIVRDASTGHLVGNTWGSRRFYEWTTRGKLLKTWQNNSFFTDYQDCQYAATAKMICGGVTNLPQTPTAGGDTATYELGGITLIDLRSHDVLREVPLQKWSSAGHVITRNPVKLAADGTRLTLWAAPDNGDEAQGTELFTYQATVTR